MLNKTLILLGALLISPALLCMENSFSPDELKYLDECFSETSLKEFGLHSKIPIFNNPSQQDMSNAVMIVLFKNNTKMACKLLMLWQDTIDINLPRTATKPISISWCIRIFPEIIDICLKLLTEKTGALAIYQELYRTVVQVFKQKIDPNLIDRDHQKSIPNMILLYPTLALVWKHSKAKRFLKEFLDDFHGQITKEIAEDAMNMCTIQNHDSHVGVANKKHCLTILQSYFPKKLSFTKERLEKTYNCHFRFKNMDKQS